MGEDLTKEDIKKAVTVAENLINKKEITDEQQVKKLAEEEAEIEGLTMAQKETLMIVLLSAVRTAPSMGNPGGLEHSSQGVKKLYNRRDTIKQAYNDMFKQAKALAKEIDLSWK